MSRSWTTAPATRITDGGGHFAVVVVSRTFRGLSRIAAQKLIYETLADLMREDIHALSMRTFTPEQWTADHHR